MNFNLRKIDSDFYLRPTLKVANDLLGKYIVRKIGDKHLIGKIVEVEAYQGEKDIASHAYRGRTKRNEVMFWVGGHLYVYFTYGMHYCCNVVTEKDGKGRAVLIRAIEPIENIQIMKTLRGFKDTDKLFNLTNGPAKVCKALAIGIKENGISLQGNEIWIGEETAINKISNLNFKIKSSTRIGITNGKELEWRFYIDNNPFVSKNK